MTDALDPRSLRHLIAVARTGSIRGAAEFLRLAPSAVSRQVADVERRLGLILFDRTARGVRVTEAGRLTLEHARRVLEDQDYLTEQLNQLKHVGQGLVRICCGEGFVADLVEHGLGVFSAVHPAVRFAIHLAGTDAVLAAVVNGDADVGVVYNPVVDVGVRSLAITRQPLCLVAPPGHPLLQRCSVTLAESLGDPCALLTVGHGVRQLVGRVAADRGLALAPVVETASIDLLRRFVGAGLGVTFLPRFAVVAEMGRGLLGAVELTDPLLAEASAHLLVRARRRLPASVERLAGCLAREMVAFRGAAVDGVAAAATQGSSFPP